MPFDVHWIISIVNTDICEDICLILTATVKSYSVTLEKMVVVCPHLIWLLKSNSDLSNVELEQ